MQTEYFFSLKATSKSHTIAPPASRQIGKTFACRLTVNIEVCAEFFYQIKKINMKLNI